MSATQISGKQFQSNAISLSGTQIKDDTLPRKSINTQTPGQSVITRALDSSDITLVSTGADSGTGDVTFAISTTGVIPGDYTKVEVDSKGRITKGYRLDPSDIYSGAVFTLPRASISSSNALTVTNYSMYLTVFSPIVNLELSTSSVFESYLLQSSAGNVRYVVYDENLSLIAYSGITANPATGRFQMSLTGLASGSTYMLVAGALYYIGILLSGSGMKFGGLATSYYGIWPFGACVANNIGSMTPPSTATIGECNQPLFIGVGALPVHQMQPPQQPR
jgi:hypothetical protein